MGCQRRSRGRLPSYLPLAQCTRPRIDALSHARGPYISSAALCTDGRVAGRTAQSVAPREGCLAAANVLSMLPARACVSPTGAAVELLLARTSHPHVVAKRPLRDGLVRRVSRHLRGVSAHDTPTHARDSTCTSVRTREAPYPQDALRTAMLTELAAPRDAVQVTAIHERVVFGNTVGAAQGRTLHRVGGESV